MASATRKGQATRSRMVGAAVDLFRRRGYDGTGLNDVLARSGAPRGSLYFHFPGGKEELGETAVRTVAEAVARGLDAALAAPADVGEAVEAAVASLADELERTEYRAGCPVAAIALDAATESERVRRACADAFERWTESVAERLRAAGHGDAAARERALTAVAAIEGGLALARVRRDPEPLLAVARQLRATLAAPPADAAAARSADL